MKTDKKPIIAFICVLLSCILVIGVTIGLLSSAGNTTAMGSTADTASTKTDNKTDNTEEPPAEEPQPEPELECGFDSESSCESLPGYLAYKSNTNTFDIDGVELTIYFGDPFPSGIEMELEDGMNIPKFNISCANYSGNEYLIREVNENYVSEKYKLTRVRDKETGKIKEIIFNHSEEIVIPKEVFCENQGTIMLKISGYNVNVRDGEEPEFNLLATTSINYEMLGPSTVLLSPKY